MSSNSNWNKHYQSNKKTEQVLSSSDLNESFEMKASGSALSSLLSKATPSNPNTNIRNLNDNNNNNAHISSYSIQFQGCNQIKHWNKNADDGDEDDVRISTKRLVRFRLVPYRKCSKYNPWMDQSGLSSVKNIIGAADYGDYVVDMEVFVEAYLLARYEYDTMNAGDDDGGNDDGNRRERGRKLYYDDDGNNGDDGNNNADDALADFDVSDYATCTQFDFQPAFDDDNNNDDNDNDIEYYLGPYCADSGSEIRLNLFEDDTCTTITQCNGGSTRGADCYTQATGNVIPYSDESIVKDPCVPCSQNYQFLSSVEDSGESLDKEYDFGYPRETCSTLYDYAGKCETHMQTSDTYGETKYTYGCSYIQGIQMGTSSNGYAVAVKRSLGADATMATLAIGSTLLGMYVYFLRAGLKKVNSQNYKHGFYVQSDI